MRRTMARRHRRWLSGDFPPSRLSRRVPFFSRPSAASLFPQSTILRKGMAVPSLTEENRRHAERTSGRSGRKTLLGLLLSVRMKDRSYLQATIANGRNGERMGKEKERKRVAARTSEKHQGNEPVKSACGTRQRFASFYSLPNLRHFYSHPSLRERLHLRNSLGCSRRTLFARHAICSYGDFRRR